MVDFSNDFKMVDAVRSGISFHGLKDPASLTSAFTFSFFFSPKFLINSTDSVVMSGNPKEFVAKETFFPAWV